MNNQNGFTLTELLVVTAIVSVIFLATNILLLSSQAAWSTTQASINLQENMRQTLLRISNELEESGSDSLGAMQVQILSAAGPNGSDILRFSIPLCVCGDNIMDANGDVAYWGATLNWGTKTCSQGYSLETNGKVKICHLPPGNPSNQQDIEVAESALSAHLDHGDYIGACTACSVSNSKFIEYRINANGDLLRRVLDDTATNIAKEDVFAKYLTDFQASINADQDIITLSISLADTTHQKRQITFSRDLKVFLKNKR